MPERITRLAGANDVDSWGDVLIDDREREAGLGQRFAQRPGLRVRWGRLVVGDYRLEPGLVVERKTTADFLASLRDGRLFTQAARLVHATARPLILVEGSWRGVAEAPWRQRRVAAAYLRLTLHWQLPVVRSRHPEESVDLMLLAARQLRPSARREIYKRPRPSREEAARRWLAQIPGLGPARADALLAHFGSVGAIFRADPQALAQAPGIGKATAQRLHSWLNQGPRELNYR